ncbi:unnamed protein product [Meloidogyne enterolobii]|uniref:Uncharacterized protein n=1 Tax=Meloidogyne enterolobii TaxID=390850 RepID=A0ACB0Z8U9_MELEN
MLTSHPLTASNNSCVADQLLLALAGLTCLCSIILALAGTLLQLFIFFGVFENKFICWWTCVFFGVF